jgi:hypothetical protein
MKLVLHGGSQELRCLLVPQAGVAKLTSTRHRIFPRSASWCSNRNARRPEFCYACWQKE